MAFLMIAVISIFFIIWLLTLKYKLCEDKDFMCLVHCSTPVPGAAPNI